MRAIFMKSVQKLQDQYNQGRLTATEAALFVACSLDEINVNDLQQLCPELKTTFREIIDSTLRGGRNTSDQYPTPLQLQLAANWLRKNP